MIKHELTEESVMPHRVSVYSRGISREATDVNPTMAYKILQKWSMQLHSSSSIPSRVVHRLAGVCLGHRMMHLHLNLFTAACNAKCKHCHAQSKKNRMGISSTESRNDHRAWLYQCILDREDSVAFQLFQSSSAFGGENSRVEGSVHVQLWAVVPRHRDWFSHR